MSEVTFDRVSKVYGNGQRALDGLDLLVRDGEFLVLVGPSGSGKTTALRMLAGLESVTEGEIRIGDRVVNELDPSERDIAMVFQTYALYPHMTVRGNIAFGLRKSRLDKGEIERRVQAMAATLGLGDLLDRRPRQLSGGQRQRVAMGRAVVRDARVCLMDEPLSNLDAKLRVQMRAEIRRLQERVGSTTIYVTHDQVEAMTMGDRVAVLRHGRLQQLDAPQTLYDQPANLFVASFIGTPPINLMEGRVVEGAGGPSVDLGASSISLSGTTAAAARRAAGRSPVAVGVRPEDVTLAFDGAGGDDLVRGVVTVVETLGSAVEARVAVAARAIRTDEALEGALAAAPGEGRRDSIAVGDANELELTVRLPARTPIATGDRVALRVDPERVLLFGLPSGEALTPGAAVVARA